MIDTLRNPRPDLPYVVRIETAELTFMGRADQPDFATLTVEYVPGDRIIELKAFKKYVQSFRDRLYSYERLATVLHDEITEAVAPRSLVVALACRARGGTNTSVTVGGTLADRRLNNRSEGTPISEPV